MHKDKKRKKRTNRLIVATLCLCFIVSGAFPAWAPPAVTQSTSSSYQSQIDEINDKLSDLQAQKAQLESNLDNVQDEMEREQAQRSQFYEELRITREQVSMQLELIEALEGDIAEKQADIERKQADIDEKYELFLRRMRAMYMYDDATLLGLVLGADSFSEFLTHTDTVLRIAEHDRTLMDELTQERIALEAEMTALESRMDELEQERLALETRRSELNTQVAAADLRIHDLDQMEREFLSDLEKNKALQAAMQQELTDIYNRIRWSENPYVGGEMAWPLPGYYRISSEYGYRFGGSDFHTGIDLTGTSVYGASIVAANAGTVRYTNWSYSPGVGYGIYVILDHGGGISTLYAHCSSLSVQVGDEVAAGQKIAEVGSTGWSTGPHLHFEVRIDGTHVNPKPYIIGNA